MEQKTNIWLEERREEYVRDAIESFLKVYLTFKDIYKEFQKEGKVKFSELTRWVGTEEEKGDLWGLKDLVHSLLDHPQESTPHELAFEHAIHLIFHQFMSFKEHIYVLEQYQKTPGERYFSKDKELSQALEEFQNLVRQIREELPGEVESANKLFENTLELLKLILPRYKKNKLLAKYLVENPQIIDEVYGKEGWKKIMEIMLPKGEEDAYCMVSKWHFNNGNYEEAKKYIDRAIKINPSSKKAKNFRRRIKKYVG